MIKTAPRSRRGRPRGDLPIAEIAKLAGVSQPTVSKVLNGRPGVGADTRRRVEGLLREHGYRRPTSAESTHGIEVVFYGMLSYIAIEIMHGVQTVASGRDLTVGFTDVRQQIAAGLPWVQPLLLRRPTGIVVAFPGVTAEHRETLEASGIPLVALDPSGDLYPTISVGSANWSGALDATRHLLDLGHRRIGVLTGPAKDLSSRARLDGFRAALDAADVPFDPELLRSGPFTFEGGCEFGRQLLGLADPPTAVICGDDLLALGVYEAARTAGVRIPEDLSVVGFDDIEQCAWVGPPLTTVRQPFADLGATAARLVLALADGQSPQQTRFELGTTLVVRGSTAPPPGDGRAVPVTPP